MTTSFQTVTRLLVAPADTSAGPIAGPSWGASVAAGLMVGFAECLLFALDLARMPIQTMVWRLFGFGASQAVPEVGTVLVFVAPVIAGCSFALLAGDSRTRGETADRPPWRRWSARAASLDRSFP